MLFDGPINSFWNFIWNLKYFKTTNWDLSIKITNPQDAFNTFRVKLIGLKSRRRTRHTISTILIITFKNHYLRLSHCCWQFLHLSRGAKKSRLIIMFHSELREFSAIPNKAVCEILKRFFLDNYDNSTVQINYEEIITWAIIDLSVCRLNLF